MEKYIFSSESVTEGHPDKVCDQISDAVLDACLTQDPNSKVAVECMAKNNSIILAGELTTKAYVDVPTIARNTIKKIGYSKEFGMDPESLSVFTQIEKQSPHIAMGVTQKNIKEQGAGDQGMMFGYATNETKELMPLPITLAHKLTAKLAQVRKNKLKYLGPDGKSQVSIAYENNKPKEITNVVISNQHLASVKQDKLRKDIMKFVIEPVCKKYLTKNTKYHINPTGLFVLGGPIADAGLTGRKIIVDTYGGMGRHGGGAFSGKDPSKVDRSAAYAARYIAKNIVGAKLADKCEVELAYAIGVAKPVSIHLDCFGTEKVEVKEIIKAIDKVFPLRPGEIIKELDLKRPIYSKTASYGHFGKKDLPWEQLNRVEKLKEIFNK
jgi:S-adenosylmethionine synthetase